MNQLTVRIRLDEGALPPHYATGDAAGADLHAFIPSPVEIPVNGHILVPTGIYIELPEGYEAQVRPRSGLAAKHCITVLNSPGTIDADYRGEVRVILINLGQVPWTVHPRERIAQLVIQPVIRAQFCVSQHISQTPRGTGGFGSTGR